MDMVTSMQKFHRRSMFLWHYPSAHADQPLTGTLPYGARTFLPILYRIARLPGQLRMRVYAIIPYRNQPFI